MTSAVKPSSLARNAVAVPNGPPPAISTSSTSGLLTGSLRISVPSRSVSRASLTPVTPSRYCGPARHRPEPFTELPEQRRRARRHGRTRRLIGDRPDAAVAHVHPPHLFEIQRTAATAPEHRDLVAAFIGSAIAIEAL